MRYVIALSVLLLPGVAVAQSLAPPQSGQDNLVTALSTNLYHALGDNDKLREQVVELQKQLDAEKKAAHEAAK